MCTPRSNHRLHVSGQSSLSSISTDSPPRSQIYISDPLHGRDGWGGIPASAAAGTFTIRVPKRACVRCVHGSKRKQRYMQKVKKKREIMSGGSVGPLLIPPANYVGCLSANQMTGTFLPRAHCTTSLLHHQRTAAPSTRELRTAPKSRCGLNTALLAIGISPCRDRANKSF